MKMNTQEVIQATENWKEVKDTLQGYNYLISGIRFEFRRGDYEKWKDLEKQTGKKIKNISCHLGVWNDELIFCFTNSITGRLEDSEIGENAFVYNFHSDTTLNIDFGQVDFPSSIITREDATRRLLYWMLYSMEWFKLQQHKERKIMYQIDIGFDDFEEIFTSKDIETLIVFFGISSHDVHGNIVEIVLCSKPAIKMITTSTKTISDLIFTDLTKPVPPFDPFI